MKTIIYSSIESSRGWVFSIAQTDGSNQKRIPIKMPTGLRIGSGQAKLTPDGTTLVFTATNTTGEAISIYSVSINGSNLKKLFDVTGINAY
jgi:Tol biopolymer transport system component